MDIDGQNFQSRMTLILRSIAASRFISFDFELSGIPGKQSARFRNAGQRETGKQTLQQRYEETKVAAERYQVLQMGLTCVEEDLERGVYIARPFNIFLNPVPDKRLEVEREFTYQSGAVDFLLGHQFRMEAPFVQGVPYFSRAEEARARSIAKSRLDKNNVPSISIKQDDADSYELLSRVRSEIAAWRTQKKSESSFLNIAPVGHNLPGYNGRGLNGYQKRLVHQLIRAEYPDLVSMGKGDFIQLIQYDKDLERVKLEKKSEWFERILTSQIGLRWVVEAICPNIDPVLPNEHGHPNSTGDLAAVTSWTYPHMDMTQEQIATQTNMHIALVQELSHKQPTLVGHNLFLDLVYFFATFVGPLPEKVESFTFMLSYMFPLIIDTKFLADRVNDNSPLYKSSLEEIDQELSHIPVPLIEIPDGHMKYVSMSPFHEAGFDSFLTARVLIRLSARTAALAQNGSSLENFRQGSCHSRNSSVSSESSDDGGVSVYDTTNINKTSVLHEDSRPGQDLSHKRLSGSPRRKKVKENGSSKRVHQAYEQIQPPEQSSLVMPPANSEFWKLYGNKLRVNGTKEEICVIEEYTGFRPSQNGTL